jgi:hypothetical protein
VSCNDGVSVDEEEKQTIKMGTVCRMSGDLANEVDNVPDCD